MEALADWGRLHPVLVHLPIGFLLALGLLEAAAVLTRSALPRRAVAPLVLASALAALAAAGAGLLLQTGGEYTGEVFVRHRTAGLVVAGLALLALVCHVRSRGGEGAVWLFFYRVALLAAIVAVGPAGHYGGSLTHGAGHLDPLLERLPRWTSDEPPSEPAEADPLPAATEARELPSPQAAPLEVAPPSAEREVGEPGAVASVLEAPSALTFAEDVAPIFRARCSTCHGENKRKAGLALHTAEGIAEGVFGDPVLVPGDPGASTIVRRLRLPLDHEEHMPPEQEPQPSEAEIALVEAWIAAGAPYEAAFAEPLGIPSGGGGERASGAEAAPSENAAADPGPAGDEDGGGAGAPDRSAPAGESAGASSGASSEAPSDAAFAGGGAERGADADGVASLDPAALARARAALVHVEELGAGSGALWVSFAAIAPSATAAEVTACLDDLREHVLHLDLSRCAVAPDVLPRVATLPRLERLELRDTPVDDAALEDLAGHPRLTTLGLAGTPVGDPTLELLAALPRLERVHLWNTRATEAGLERLAAARPSLEATTGDEPPARVLDEGPTERAEAAASATD